MNELPLSAVKTQTSASVSDALLCPACSGQLRREGATVTCSQKHVFPITDGIPVLAKDSAYHFLFPSKEQMENAFPLMDQQGFWSGMDYLTKDLDAEATQDLFHYMVNETRAAWKVLLPDLKSKRVLDYACGWGNLSVALARSAKEVHGIDLSLQRVRFARRHAEHEQLSNVRWVVGGDVARLPFPDGHFDIVILNGILEWIPTSRDLDKSPTEAQLSFLKELARITAPNGLICLAIENRIGFKYFVGNRDEHTRLRYMTLLPRFLANIYSKQKRGKPFREYTHTIYGYKKLLKAAGFPQIEPYIPFPTYRQFDTLLPYRSPRGIFTFLGRRRKIAHLSANVIARAPQFAHAFVILAGKSSWENSPSVADKLAVAYPSVTPEEVRPWRVLGTGSAMAYGRQQSRGSDLVIKVPLTPKAERSNEEAVTNLTQLHRRTETPSWLKSMISTPLDAQHVDGFRCFVQSRLSGTEGTQLALNPELRETIFQKGAELLIRLHKDTVLQGVVGEETYRKSIEPCVRLGVEMLNRSNAPKDEVQALIEQIRAAFMGKECPLVLCHGDYWLKNVLFDKATNEPTAIIDWDRMHFHGPPLTDLLNLMLMSERRSDKNGFYEILKTICIKVQPSRRKGMLGNYFNAVPIPDRILNALCVIYFLQRLPEERPFATKEDLRFAQQLLTQR